MHQATRHRVWGMGIEDFVVLWVWGYCGIPTGFSVGSLWDGYAD